MRTRLAGVFLFLPLLSSLRFDRLVARALERTDAVFELDPSAMLPADLAKHYGVKP